MHILDWVALVLGAVIVLLVALLRVLRDLWVRDFYAAPQLPADADPPRRKSTAIDSPARECLR